MGLPPVLDGAFQDTPTFKTPPAGATLVGAAGTDALEPAESGDGAELPAALVATTEKRYVVPTAKPVIVHDVVALEQVLPAGLELTVYFVMALPWLSGATQLTLADVAPLARATIGAAGAKGTLYGVTALLAALEGPPPKLFVATTVNV